MEAKEKIQKIVEAFMELPEEDRNGALVQLTKATVEIREKAAAGHRGRASELVAMNEKLFELLNPRSSGETMRSAGVSQENF